MRARKVSRFQQFLMDVTTTIIVGCVMALLIAISVRAIKWAIG